MFKSLSCSDASLWRLSERWNGEEERFKLSIGLDTDILATRGMTKMTFSDGLLFQNLENLGMLLKIGCLPNE